MWVFVWTIDFFFHNKKANNKFSNLSGGAEAMMASGGVIRGQKGQVMAARLESPGEKKHQFLVRKYECLRFV